MDFSVNEALKYGASVDDILKALLEPEEVAEVKRVFFSES